MLKILRKRYMPALAGLVFVGELLAQSAPPNQAPPPTPAGVLAELRAFYQSQPTCERMQIEVRSPAPPPAVGTRVHRSSIIVRLNPESRPADAPAESPPRVDSLSLDLSQLAVSISDGRLVAIHERDPASAFETSFAEAIDSRTLARVLPPLILPQLEFATTAAPLDAVLPYADKITWQSAESDSRQPQRRTLKGQFPAGTVELTAQGPRLRTLRITHAARNTTITLNCSPVAPCDPSKFEIDTARRTRVESLAELQPRVGTLRPGNRVSAMPLTRAAGQAWSIEDLLSPPFEASVAGIGPAEHVVLVFIRALPDGTPSDLPRFRTDRLAVLLRDMHAEVFRPRAAAQDEAIPMSRFGYAPVLVMSAPTPDEVLRRLKNATQEWGGAGKDSDKPPELARRIGGTDVLWTTEARASIDLFAPGAEAVAVILDPEMVLRSVVPVARNDTAEQVADKIAAALFELMP